MKQNFNVGLRLFMVALLLCMVYLLASQIPGAETILAMALPLAKKDKKEEKEEDEDDEEEDEETKALLDKVRVVARKEILQRVKAFNEDGETKINQLVDKKMEVFKDIPLDKLKQAVEQMEEANEAIAQLKAAQMSGEEKKKETLLQTKLKEAYPDIVKHLKAGHKSFSFQVAETKAPDLVNAASFGDRVIFGFREAGVSFAALPELFILDLIQVMTGGPGSNPLSWVERNVHTQAGPPAIVENPTGVLESGTKPQLGYQWVENKISAETIAAMVPVTKQAIFNYTMLEQEVRFELIRRLASVLQQQIINGTGVSPQLKGINTYATAFAAGGFAALVNEANEFDVLVAAATQILQANYVPTAALVSHLSKGMMTLAKDANGTYALPPFSTADGLNVFGMRVIGTNEMPTDQFIAGDFSKSLFNWVENITIEVGMIDDDFAKNQYRIRGELQGMHRIKEHEKLAFVKGDFSVAKAALETP